MAIIQTYTYSTSLSRVIDFRMLLPNDPLPEMIAGNEHYNRPMKTLYLLHGFSASNYDWLGGSLIQELALKYNLAVVMPSGENSFYLNIKGTGGAYETFTGVELPAYCQRTFGLSAAPADNYIGGLSMGGFGAIHTGLRHPETFGKMFGLSSALIVRTIAGIQPGYSDFIADYDYYTRTFGDLNALETSVNNPEYVVKTRQAAGETIQPIYMACGSEDPLVETNRVFRDFLTEQNVDLTYVEGPGVHDWQFWNAYLEPAIQWMLA